MALFYWYNITTVLQYRTMMEGNKLKFSVYKPPRTTAYSPWNHQRKSESNIPFYSMHEVVVTDKQTPLI